MKIVAFIIVFLSFISCSNSKNETINWPVDLSVSIEEDISNQFYLRDFVIDTTDVFLYARPNLSSDKIQALEIDEPVIFLATKDNWVKINVKKNGNIGYVNKSQIWPYD